MTLSTALYTKMEPMNWKHNVLKVKLDGIMSAVSAICEEMQKLSRSLGVVVSGNAKEGNKKA